MLYTVIDLVATPFTQYRARERLVQYYLLVNLHARTCVDLIGRLLVNLRRKLFASKLFETYLLTFWLIGEPSLQLVTF